MEFDKEENGFISVPAPEFGAIFMSNIAIKRDCFKHKVFGLPSSMANFVKEVKKGMILFLFEYERRQLFGVYQAISDGEMNIAPHAFSSSGKQFSAQVRFVPIWYCSPLSENEFRDAIRENYFSSRKFHFGLSDEQVHRLLRLFSSRKLKNKLPPRMLTTGVSNGVDEDHIVVNNNSYAAIGDFDIKRSDVDLEPSLSRGYPRSFRGVKRVNDDMFLIEHRVKDRVKIDSAEHLYYNDKKRRLGYDGRLLRDNAAEDRPHIHSFTEHEENLVVRDQIVNEDNMDGNFGLGRSNQQRKTSDGDRTRINQKGMRKDGRLFTREISRNESKFHTGLGRGFDHQVATEDDECFLSRRKGANKKYVDSFLIPAASDGNSAYAGDVGRQVAEVGSYPMNDFDRLVPGTDNFQRPLTVAGRTCYFPMNKRTSGYSTMFLAETEFPQSIEAQNLGPSCSKFHDATIPRVMPHKHECPSSCYEHTETYEVEQSSNFVQKQPSSDVYKKNKYASFRGISSPYSYPEFTKRGLESASEDGQTILLRSRDGFNTPHVNVGISEAMEPNRSRSFSYRTAFIPRESIGQQFRDDISEDENRRFSSQAALSSTAHSYSGNCQCADEQLGDEHVIWQGSDIIHVGRRSRSPNSSWLLRQGNVLRNLDHANSPGADIVNNEYEDNILTDVVHSDSRNSRSVFNRLSLAPKVRKLREQVADHSMSYDEYSMDTSVDEIMDLLYEDQNIVPKKPLNRKPFIRKVGYGETNRSGGHAPVVKNDAEQPGDSVVRFLRESANEVLEVTVNHVLAETRVVDFKRRRETNRASEQANAKFNEEEKTNASEHAVLQNAQDNSSKTAVAKDSTDKPSKRRKLVRPVFDENNSSSDLNHQLPCQTVDKVNTGNSDSNEFQSAL